MTVVLWDAMGTLVYDPFYREVPAHFGMSFDELIEAKHPDAWVQFELGRIDEADMLANFFADGRDFDVAALRRAWVDSYQWLPGMQPLLAELRERGVEMHIASNYSPWYRYIDDKLGVSDYAPWSFVSCHLGARKPEDAFYETILGRLGARPDSCLFIDDRARNCEGARRHGIEILCFEDADATRTRLVELGVL